MTLNYSPTSSSSHFPDAEPFIGVVEDTVSALRLVRAAKLGMIPRIVRRLNDLERQHLIVPGAVLIFSVEESGIKRWTDGRLWSPSRIAGNFLVYKELQGEMGSRNPKTPASPEDSSRRGESRNTHWDVADANRLRHQPSLQTTSSRNGTLKIGGLNKKTITVSIDGSDHHLISYYTQDDLKVGRLKTLATRPDISNLVLEPRMFRLGSFRNPPKVINGPDGELTIAPGPEEVEPLEYLTDGLPHRATRPPGYHIDRTDEAPSLTGTAPRPQQSVHYDESSTASMNPVHAPIRREEHEGARMMVDQYQQGTHWVTTTASAEEHRTDDYLDYQTPDGQVHERRGLEQHQSWRGSPELQYLGKYTPSPSDTTVCEQREAAGLSDGGGYEERMGLTTLYGNPHSDQRTHNSRQTQYVGSAYPLGWPKSAQRHEFPASDTAPVLSMTARSKPAQTLPRARQMYTGGSASVSSWHQVTVSPSQQQPVQPFPDTEQMYFSYRAPVQEGTDRYYERREYEDNRSPPTGNATN